MGWDGIGRDGIGCDIGPGHDAMEWNMLMGRDGTQWGGVERDDMGWNGMVFGRGVVQSPRGLEPGNTCGAGGFR